MIIDESVRLADEMKHATVSKFFSQNYLNKTYFCNVIANISGGPAVFFRGGRLMTPHCHLHQQIYGRNYFSFFLISGPVGV